MVTDTQAQTEPKPRELVRGTTLVFLAEGLIFPTGLLTAAFLTRWLGPDGYGLLTIAATIVTWAEWTIQSLFASATVRYTSNAADWRDIGTAVLRLQLAAGLIGAAAIIAVAIPTARLLGVPVLAVYLVWFSIDVPIYCTAQAHMNLLVGTGRFSEHAVTVAVRMLARLALMLVAVGSGCGVPGAIAASIGASTLELAVARRFIKPSLRAPSTFPLRKFWGYALPLFVFAFSMLCFDKVDLIALKALGGTTADAGRYGAAQNLALVPLLFASILANLLLSTIGELKARRRLDQAAEVSRNAIRTVIVLIPFAGMTAGCANEVVAVIFGTDYAPTAPLFSLLIFAGIAMGMLQVTAAVLAAADRPRPAAVIAVPLVLLALGGHIVLIPILGALGAALVTLVLATAGAIVSMVTVRRLCGVELPWASVARSAAVTALAWVLADRWAAPGAFLVVKITAISAVIAAGFFVLRETNAAELRKLYQSLRASRL